MRALLQICSVMMVLCLFSAVQAHEGHEHGPVTMKKATEIALAVARDGSAKAQPALDLGQLDKTWGKLPAEAAKIIENGRGYYVVKVDNSAQSKTLYVRVLLDGRVDAANFSGEFAHAADVNSVIP